MQRTGITTSDLINSAGTLTDSKDHRTFIFADENHFGYHEGEN